MPVALVSSSSGPCSSSPCSGEMTPGGTLSLLAVRAGGALGCSLCWPHCMRSTAAVSRRSLVSSGGRRASFLDLPQEEQDILSTETYFRPLGLHHFFEAFSIEGKADLRMDALVQFGLLSSEETNLGLCHNHSMDSHSCTGCHL